MESDTFYEYFMVEVTWRLSGNLIYHVFYIKTPDNLQTNFTIKSSCKVLSSTLFRYSLHSGN